MTEELLERWCLLVDHPQAPAAGRELLARWAEPHRRYHDLTHLAEVLDRIEELAAVADDADAVRLAAFFHDAVYEIGATDNEERSAALAATCLADLGVSPDRVDRVARLVRLTATHTPDGPYDTDAAVLCDADLAVLGSGPAQYADYAARVREEYRAVPDELFRPGRAAVLAALSSRSPLYATPQGRAAWEVAAHHNLTTELELLRLAP